MSNLKDIDFAGCQIGNYRLEELKGKGGEGLVYRAKDLSKLRPCLKTRFL